MAKTSETGPVNSCYQLYIRMLNQIMSLMGLDMQMMTKIQESVITFMSEHNSSLSRPPLLSERETLMKMSEMINGFLSNSSRSFSVIVIQSCYRRHFAMRSLRLLREPQTKAIVETMRELLRREKNYVLALETISKDYMTPLQATTDRQIREQTKDSKSIFSNIEEIASLHRVMLRRFQEAIDVFPHKLEVSEAFLNLAPRFRIYGPYVHNFKFAMDTLSRYLTHEKYSLSFPPFLFLLTLNSI